MQGKRTAWLGMDERAAVTASANRRSRSFSQLRSEAAPIGLDAHREATRQPKRGEPGYVYRGVPWSPDPRIAIAEEWGEQMASAHPAERAGRMRAADRARKSARVQEG